MTQVVEPEQAPDQPENVELEVGSAINVTEVPEECDVVEEDIPVIYPFPVPSLEAVSVKEDEVLFVKIVTGGEVVWFPEVSLATAVRVCEPFDTEVVFHDTEYGAEIS